MCFKDGEVTARHRPLLCCVRWPPHRLVWGTCIDGVVAAGPLGARGDVFKDCVSMPVEKGSAESHDA